MIKALRLLLTSKPCACETSSGFSGTALLLGMTLAAGMLTPTSTQAQGAGAFPPNSHAFGNTMGEWLKQLVAGSITIQGKTRQPLQLEDKVETTTGSGTLADPLIWSISGAAHIKPGVATLQSPIAWIAPTPDQILPDSYWGFGNYTTAEVILDGQTITSQENCLNYYVPPQIYDPVLPNGAYAVQGFFCLLHPLSPGVHTISQRGTVMLPPGNLVAGPFEFGLEIVQTTTITVAP